jgi:hypothetical protein
VTALALACESAPKSVEVPHSHPEQDAGGPAPSKPSEAAPNEVDSENGECPTGYALCDQRCVDLDTHPDHCGACGDFCGRRETCVVGKCVDCEEDPDACDTAESRPGNPSKEPEPSAPDADDSASDEPTTSAEPEPSARTEPVAAPEPAAAPEPVAAPEPAAAPEPVSSPEPAAGSEPAAAPEPAPEPGSEPAPEPTAEPSVQPEPEPGVEPQVSPEPDPVAEPEPATSTDCTILAPNTGSGEIGTGEVCFLFQAPVTGWEVSNFRGTGRTVTVDGVMVQPGAAFPAPMGEYYTVVFSAGPVSYVSVSYW